MAASRVLTERLSGPTIDFIKQRYRTEKPLTLSTIDLLRYACVMSEGHREGRVAEGLPPVRPAEGAPPVQPRQRVPSGQPVEEVADALGELFSHMRAHFERVVLPYNLPPPCAKALRLIDGSISMKELGSRIHCDASFITAIADALEERGLARREIDRGDRRIKNLVLTNEGTELRSRLARDLFDDLPGVRNLKAGERESFLALLHKMLGPEKESGGRGEPRL